MQKAWLLTILVQFLITSGSFAQFKEGEIKKRKDDIAVTNISLGWELKLGEELLIYRNIDSTEQVIGKGTVIELTEKLAFIKIIQESPKLKVKRGDWIASLKDDYAILLEPFKLPNYFLKIKFGYGSTPLGQVNTDIKSHTISSYSLGYETNGKEFPSFRPTYSIEFGKRISEPYKASFIAEYVSSNTTIDCQNMSTQINIDKKLKHANLLVNGYYYYESLFQKFNLFVGLGIGFSYTYYETHINQTEFSNQELRQTANSTYWGLRVTEQVMTGLEVQVSKRIGICIEAHYRFRRMFFLEENVSGEISQSPPASRWLRTTRSTVDFTGGLINFGLTYYR